MGCEQSIPVADTRSIKGVGQSERLVSRAERLRRQQNTTESLSKLQQPAQQQQLLSSNGVVSATRSSSNKSSPSNAASSAAGENNNIKMLVPPKLNIAGNLMPEEIVRRTDCSVVSKEIVLGTLERPIHVEYAHWTQRGYYPDTPHKENQDRFGIALKFAGEERGALMAVYDGHGATGHACSVYAEKKLPALTAKWIRQARVKKYKAYMAQHNIKGPAFDPTKWPLLTEDEYQVCCKKAFLECNEAMHKDDKVEDKMSGTTAISVHFHGDLLTVCNVGDSRVVLGHAQSTTAGESSQPHKEDEKKEETKEEIGEHDNNAIDDCKDVPAFLAIPLSRDQTPYRKDERERIKKLGGSIMTIDQMEGKEEMHENWGDMVLGEVVDIHGDPPRVWEQDKDYPGCAFTRSIGDYLAEGIGVTAEPEILTTRLTSNDQFLVIASDGIFEFLANQEVINICARSDNPLMACQSLVEAAYDQWLIHENRTDDITVIVCFLKCYRSPDEGETTGTSEDLVGLSKSMYGSKPLRGLGRFSTVDSEATDTAAMTDDGVEVVHLPELSGR